jgi:NADH dehydrogenase [ubiquinone] 1 alpha subcomplex assembly factor 7
MSPYVLNCLKSSDSILFIYLSCIWQGTAKFKDFLQSLSVHMVKCSPALKSIQQQTLKCHPKDQADSTCAVDGQKGKPTEDQISQILGAAISWHLDLEYVPQGVPTIIIAHEFYDALPIHQFQAKDTSRMV